MEIGNNLEFVLLMGGMFLVIGMFFFLMGFIAWLASK